MPTVHIASCFASFASTALYPRDTSCSEVGPAKVVEASKSQKAGLIAGLVAGFCTPRLPMRVPRRDFGLYSWLAAMHGDALLHELGNGHVHRGMDIRAVEEKLGDFKARYHTS